MRESRNPFRLRAAEQIESDSTFARLFEPGMLDALPPQSLSVPLTVLQSAPGAGKSSLLRLFTPSVLEHVRQNGQREEYKELSARLRALGAFTPDAVQVLGAPISCAQTFANLDELEGRGQTASLRLFLALLNARIILSVLRSAASYCQTPLATWLGRARVAPPDGVELPGVAFPCTGAELHGWASTLEGRVAATLDHFGPISQEPDLRSPDTLVALSLFGDGALAYEELALPKRVLVLLDDVQWLTERQREALRTSTLRGRSPAMVWMAERYESLAPDEVLEGAREGRDIVLVRLENFWRQSANKRKLEHFLRNLGNRRARVATDVEVHSLDDNLRDILEGPKWTQLFEQALRTVMDRVELVGEKDSRFRDWIAEENANAGSAYEKLLNWRRLEILVERVRGRAQLDFGLVLDPSQREESDGSDIGAAAALFVAREFKLPYYFGSATLTSLASSNVEQYLALAGDFFEEIVSATLLGRASHLVPLRQDRLVRDAASARWKEIPSRVNHGRAIKEFLQNAGSFAAGVTYRPTAPYTPGVTGFAYLMRDQDRLYKKYPELASILASAVADNLLEMSPEYLCKGKAWMLYYFNRLLCVQFDLPLGYGGFREQRLETLDGWRTGRIHSVQRDLMGVTDGVS